mmetsp:Transcript_81040/g.204025  ORF Transcript_81040/g.204025 Transcript_81040/m.204025 type:complete len:374 (+) Transcript_81040:674-1795(+)
MLPRAVAPVPQEPAVRRLPVGLQLCRRKGGQRLVLLLRAVARRARRQGEGPLADHGGHAAEDLAVALGHPQVRAQRLPLPPRPEAVVEVQIEGHVRVAHEAVVVPAPEPPNLVEPLGAVDGQDDADLVRRHASLPDRAHGAVVELAEHARRHRLGRLVADGNSCDCLVTSIPCRDSTQGSNGLVEAPVLPAPILALAAARLLATLAAGGAVQVQQNLEAVGVAPSNDPVDVVHAWPHELVLVGRAGDDPVAERNANCVHAQGPDAPDVVLRDESLTVDLQHLASPLSAQCLPHLAHQMPLAMDALKLVEQRRARPGLQQQPAPEVDAPPRWLAPVEMSLVVKKAEEARGSLREVEGNLAPIGIRCQCHCAHPG